MPRAKSKHAYEVKPTTGKLDAVNTDTEISVKRTHKRTTRLIALAKKGFSAPDIAAAVGMPKKQVYNTLAYHGVKAGKARISRKNLLRPADILKLVESGVRPREIATTYGIKVQRVYNAVSYYKTHKLAGKSFLTKEDVDQQKVLVKHLQASATKTKKAKKTEDGISVTVQLSKQQVDAIVAKAAAQAVKSIDIDILVDKAVREWSRRMIHTGNA